jgi:hypothetical protein
MQRARAAKTVAFAVALVALAAAGGASTATAGRDTDEPKVCDVSGLWQGEFNSSEGNPNLGAVTLTIEQDHRRFHWTAVATNGQVAMGDGTISASGQTHIKGEGPTLEVTAHGVVNCLAGEGVDGSFEYRARMGDFTDRGMVQIAHVIRGGGD